MPELKATRLLKTERGRDLLHDVLEQVEGRYIASIIDKRLSLMAKLFEYIYEPALQSNNLIFYRNNFHKFVANFLYFGLYNEPLEGLAGEFEAFISSLDPARADVAGVCARIGDDCTGRTPDTFRTRLQRCHSARDPRPPIRQMDP